MSDLLVTMFGKPGGIVVYQLLFATQFTIYLSLIAFFGGGLVGAVITFLRILPNRAARSFAISYIWFFQSAPLLMLLFLTGLGAPRLFDVVIDPWVAASFSLTVYASAYLADVWRGAIESVPKGQWEGGRSLGVTFVQILVGIILPQAVRTGLAPTVGFLVQIIKGTSLAYIIGFHDLMAIGKRWANAPVPGTEPFVIFPLMALIYFCLCYPLSLYARHLETKLRTPTQGVMPKPLTV